MGLLGILVGLSLLIFFAFRGWSVLLLAPIAALVAAAFGAQPLLANWTQIFMVSAASFLAQFFPIFLLGAVFGKLMDDCGAVASVAAFMARCFGERRAILAVVLAGALVTYGAGNRPPKHLCLSLKGDMISFNACNRLLWLCRISVWLIS